MADQDVERLDARMLDDVNHLDRQAHRMVDASSDFFKAFLTTSRTVDRAAT
jgi:hypothetical protein